MIHKARITKFTEQGEIDFELDGKKYHATHAQSFEEVSGLIEAGVVYPLEIEIVMDAPVDYLNPPSEGLDLIEASSDPKLGDLVCVRGRITDYLEHDVIRIDGAGSARVRLKLPQQATDYRRGSYLSATGRLTASIPSPDHDEAGLKGSIVE